MNVQVGNYKKLKRKLTFQSFSFEIFLFVILFDPKFALKHVLVSYQNSSHLQKENDYKSKEYKFHCWKKTKTGL